MQERGEKKDGRTLIGFDRRRKIGMEIEQVKQQQ